MESLIRIYSLKWVGSGWALIWVWFGGGGGGRLFEAGRLLTFSAFRMGAYSRWAPIRGRALIRIKNYVDNLCPFFFSILFCWSCFNKHFLWIPYLKIARKSYVWMYLPFISSTVLRACLHGGGGPQVGEVTRLGGVTRLSIQSLILIWSRWRDR